MSVFQIYSSYKHVFMFSIGTQAPSILSGISCYLQGRMRAEISVSLLLKCLHSILLSPLSIISLNRKSHSRLSLSKKKRHFLNRSFMAAQSAVLPLWLARAAVQPYLHPTTAREGNGFFSPLGNSWGGSLLCSGSPRSPRLL